MCYNHVDFCTVYNNNNNNNNNNNKLSQNIPVAKSMVYTINQSYGDFQQGGCLYKPTSSIQWTPEHSWTSDRPLKQASAKADLSTFGSGVLAVT